MKFFVIPPLSALELMHEGTAGYYCLAHLYVKYPAYKEFFLKVKKDQKFILLDNGAAEQDLVTEDVLLDIVGELKPDLVIPPDVLLDKEKTMKNFLSFLTRYKERRYHHHTMLFACPQGSTKEEWIECYKYMSTFGCTDRIGLSKIAVPYCWNQIPIGADEMILESRHACIEELMKLRLLDIDIHCLGAGDMREFKYYKNFKSVVSTDSCNAIWSAMNDISFEDGNFERIPTPKDYFERTITTKQYALALKNINWLKNNLP